MMEVYFAGLLAYTISYNYSCIMHACKSLHVIACFSSLIKKFVHGLAL